MPITINGSGTLTGLSAGGLPDGSVQVADFAFTNTPSAGNFARGDGTWNSPITQGTSVASTSGTAIDFTGIPSWAKRITVLLSGVSLNGSGMPVIQIGAGSIDTTGYVSYAGYVGASSGATTSTSYFLTRAGSSANADIIYGIATIALVGSNTWAYNLAGGMFSASSYGSVGGGTKTLSGALDRVRITTSNGTDTFDAGSINIFWE